MATTGEDLNPRERITFSALRGMNPHNQRVKKSPQRVGAKFNNLQTNLIRVSRHQNEKKLLINQFWEKNIPQILKKERPSQGALVRCKGSKPLHPYCFERLETASCINRLFRIAFVYRTTQGPIRFRVDDRICEDSRKDNLYPLYLWLNIFFLYHDFILF